MPAYKLKILKALSTKPKERFAQWPDQPASVTQVQLPCKKILFWDSLMYKTLKNRNSKLKGISIKVFSLPCFF